MSPPFAPKSLALGIGHFTCGDHVATAVQRLGKHHEQVASRVGGAEEVLRALGSPQHESRPRVDDLLDLIWRHGVGGDVVFTAWVAMWSSDSSLQRISRTLRVYRLQCLAVVVPVPDPLTVAVGPESFEPAARARRRCRR